MDRNQECDFYFMAYFWKEENKWEFFDDEYNNDNETRENDRMIVTHWSNSINLEQSNAI